jgi:hypothetical protein
MRQSQAPQDEKQQSVERLVWIYLATFLSFTCLAWLLFIAKRFTGATFPLSDYRERFGDLAHFAATPPRLANPVLEDVYFLRGTMFPRNYGPLAVLIYFLLLRYLAPNGIIVFLAVVVGSRALACFLLWRAARRSPAFRPFMAIAIFATGLLALPTAETELRGNIEGLLWIGYAMAVGYMVSRRWTKAASVLGIAACIKPYPLFLFMILLYRRKYKALLAGGLVLVATFGGALTLLGHGSPLRGAARIQGGGTLFFDDYIVGLRSVDEAALDHSAFEAAKSASRVIHAHGFRLPDREYHHRNATRTGHILLKIYIPLVAGVVLWILWCLRRKPFLNQIFALSICLTVFPFIAADYTLTILYLPMGLFLLFLLREVATGQTPIPQPTLLSIVLPCALLMSPLHILGIWAGDAKTLLLLFLLFPVIASPMPMDLDRAEPCLPLPPPSSIETEDVSVLPGSLTPQASPTLRSC